MQFQKTLTTAEGMEEFRTLSNMFRAGDYYPQKYYESCQDVLSTKFDEIFPELLVLLPDISKQQASLIFLLNIQNGKNNLFLYNTSGTLQDLCARYVGKVQEKAKQTQEHYCL